MEKTFWIDPYQSTLHTRVAAINNDELVLEKTIAFSFSGGQESDKAFINGIEIPVIASIAKQSTTEPH
ncbi:hypothetical protein [Legionella quateirensis]|uniref:Alanyl tRNA synthetase n=1 Tax=Legionella quateirensis TaxID=45072 RepID=A0A378KTI9_9GAMM|nr:hypothetical protein [Legionella quateirensis]KTD54751.1 alanyl tRNA synthetase [Legionella quateirensis]STY16931.1 alanyl tRNA synthetase [Legionella quateirensis]